MTRRAGFRPPRRSWRRLGRRLHEAFAPVGGNVVVATERGASFFDGMFNAIESATATVDVEMYLWYDDEVGRRFVEALRAAAVRGLRVRILVDAYGARDVLRALDAVLDAGGDVRVFNPFRMRFLQRWIHRTHKKLLVADGRIAFTGGAGFSLHWSGGRTREEPWHDRMFEVRGPVVRQLIDVFETDLNRWPPRRVQTPVVPPDATIDLTHPGASHLRVLRGWPDARDFRATLLLGIRDAKERVWLATPYFIPPPSLLHALHRALRRGVEVQIVVPSSNDAHPLLWHASRRHYGLLLRRGAKIHEYAHGFYHAKLAVIDRRTAIIGSSNLDYWSWNRNAEIDLVATDAPTVELVAEWFRADVARSAEVTLRDVGMRSWFARQKERVAGWVEGWL